ncbi:MAG: FAD-dependent oxidoreductase [Endomicrobiia bacterium]|nr:FAD-dependent oxidoreductase [Endomicrobiia bacterium]
MSSRKTDTLILGGGITGLAVASCAGELPKGWGGDTLILEKENVAGGLCRSKIKDGFTYDYSGHLLHLRRPEIKKWIFELLDGNLREVARDARIYSEGRLTKYPYQMNLWGLPAPTIKECLAGLMDARLAARRPGPSGSFLEWSLDVFGAGITKHFMKPYNEKLFRLPSGDFNAEWCGGFVPRPSLEDVLRGALSDAPKPIGYNATFFYPQRGGIQSLVDALAAEAARSGEIRLGVAPEKIDLSSKTAVLSDGSEVKYRRLVSTIPLDAFARVCALRSIASRLRSTPVVCFNIGVKGNPPHAAHWMYFPEKKFNFYRVGFYSNINPASAPKGHYSMYVEVSFPSGKRRDIARALNASVEGLKSAGLLSSSGDIVSLDIRPMPNAYVVYDFERARAIEKIRAVLVGKDVHLAGRYGAWKYSYMEESLAEARGIAESIV